MGGVEDHPSGRKRTNHLQAIPNGNTVSADAQAEEYTMRRHSKKNRWRATALRLCKFISLTIKCQSELSLFLHPRVFQIK